jgi:hypothetical protein
VLGEHRGLAPGGVGGVDGTLATAPLKLRYSRGSKPSGGACLPAVLVAKPTVWAIISGTRKWWIGAFGSPKRGMSKVP